VHTTFDTPDRPSFEALKGLPFFPDEDGMYAKTVRSRRFDRYIDQRFRRRSPPGPAWTSELGKSSIDEWFHLVNTFVPPEVHETFNVPTRSSFEAIRKLPFFPDDNGVYADTLETEDDKYIYPGAAPHQTQKLRKNNHNVTTVLRLYPNSAYYRIKHSASIPCQSHFVSLLRIPIPHTLDPQEKAVRRLLCRIGEAMFSFWLCAFNETGKGAKLADEAKKLSKKIYGNGRFEWQGVLSHSPFAELSSPSFVKD
jgi:hypothetical protein